MIENGTLVDRTTTNAVPTATKLYFAIWKKAGSNCYAGFTTTRPTKLSDFAAGNYVDFGDVGDFTGKSFTDWKCLYSANHITTLGAKAYYTLMSKKSQTIIDNDS